MTGFRTELLKKSPQKRQEEDREWRRLVVVILFLLLSMLCVICSSQSALYFIDQEKILGRIKVNTQADYGPGPGLELAPLEQDKIAAEVLRDQLELLATPSTPIVGAVIVTLPQFTPAAFVPSPTPVQIVVTATPAPPTPTEPPTATATSPAPAATSTAASSSPTSPPPTSVPTATAATTTTPPPATATILPATATAPPPTSTPLPPTSIPPTATPVPTSSPTNNPTATATAATTPSPTLTPTSTPSPTLTPTSTPSPTVTPTSTPSPTLTPTSTPVNQPPLVAADTAAGPEDTLLSIDVLANDTDPDGALVPATLAIVTPPGQGSAAIDTNANRINYSPGQDFNGVDVFAYRVCDDDGACASATVTLTITPVNDPPVANNDTADTAEDTLEIVPVLANDLDVEGDPLLVTAVGQPGHGVVNTNGTVVIYFPNANFDGTDIFTYTISDGALTDTATVTVTVIAINDPPVGQTDAYTTTQNTVLVVAAPGVLVNDTDIDGDPLTAALATDVTFGALTLSASGAFTYTPALNFTGTDSFSYRADDGHATSNLVSVTILVQ